MIYLVLLLPAAELLLYVGLLRFFKKTPNFEIWNLKYDLQIKIYFILQSKQNGQELKIEGRL